MPKGEWQGTIARVSLRVRLIGDFDILLDTCRALAAEARDDPFLQALEFIDTLEDSSDGYFQIPVNDFYEDVEAAARIRDHEVIPKLLGKEVVILDFSGIRVITQSFAHAILYKILRDLLHVRSSLFLFGCTNAVKAAIRAVAAYARSGSKQG